MKRFRATRIFSFLFAFILGGGLFFVLPAFAQSAPPDTAGALSSFGGVAGFATHATLPVLIAQFIRAFISFLGIIAVIFVVYGGFVYMTAGGDPKRLETAKRLLRNAIIGLVIALSSFVIAQFVIGQLEKAAGAPSDITGASDAGGCPGCVDGHINTRRHFALQGWNQACDGLVRNAQIQFSFTQAVSSASLNKAQNPAIEVKSSAGESVAGIFSARGATVTFTPMALCPGANPGSGSEHCFGANTDYTISFNTSVLKSATGAAFECGGGFSSCVLRFHTGAQIDVTRPTVDMVVPDIGGFSASAGSVVPLQARVRDDVGGSLALFFADDSSKPVFAASVAQSTGKKIAPDNLFSTNASAWDTAGYAPKSYGVWAEASDCAGHQASSAKTKVTLLSAQCSNNIKDAGEGDPWDCGPVCEVACAGGACSAAAPCAVGLTCKDNLCISTPRIDRVTPGDGAIGNFITISGDGFGTGTGSIIFLGDPNNGSDDVMGTFPAACTDTWTNRQVIVQIPLLAKDGPLELRAADYEPKKTKADRTNDAFGIRISDFVVNATVRPGLCSLAPASADGPASVKLSGANFGSSQGMSAVYFGAFTPASYGAWSPTSIQVTSPRLDPHAYDVQVFTGANVCQGTKNVCAADADCGTGACVSNREGSNPVSFMSKPLSESVLPRIVSIDTGWKACDKAGNKNSQHCVIDADCGGGVCVSVPTWGPVGQYVTITGTNFGASGVVRFRDEATGKVALADIQFPPSCGNAIWNDTTAVVKIPARFQDDTPIGVMKLSLLVDRGGIVSPKTDMQVVAGRPGPGMCRIDPTGGPISTLVKIYGEHFSLGTEKTVFTPQVDAPESHVINGEEASARVPTGAKTGPIRYERTAPDRFVSNAVNFSVGSCRDKTLTCKAGEQCCADGTCGNPSCGFEPKPAHYAYLFSTGPIPTRPHVIVACKPEQKMVSPSPWEGWSAPSSICPSAPVVAQFDRAMDETSFVKANVRVQSCTGKDIHQPCVTLGAPLDGTIISSTALSFQWQPTLAFEADHSYQVTLLASGLKSVSQKNPDGIEIGLTPLENDFEWRFRTAKDRSSCRVGSLMLLPDPFTATEQGQVIDYLASPLSAGDPCVVLACDASYQMTWSVDHAEVILNGPKDPTLQCDNHAKADLQIPDADHSAKISAELRSEIGTPKSDAKLIVEFAKPKVVEQWPGCGTQNHPGLACVNAQIGAKFNVAMQSGDFNTSTVKMYACENELCRPQTRLPMMLASVSYPCFGASACDAPRLTAVPAQALQPDTFYQMVLSGSLRAAHGGAELSGSYNGGDYSWTFRTQKTSQPCGIDHVLVEPADALMTYIGERQAFTAVPVGSADACAPMGQRLDATSFHDWKTWTVTDTPLGKDEPVHVADVLPVGSGISGAIAIFPQSRLPAFCTSACLQAGSSVLASQAICGDGKLDGNSEDCEGSAHCSVHCLRTPVDACALTCGNTAAACTAATAGNDCANVCGASGHCSLSGEACTTASPCRTLSCGVPSTATNCCGNGKKEGEEECDDGSGSSVCSSQCLNAGSTTFCGNGKIEREAGEECDDGNRVNGDGCSSLCLHEGSVPQSQVFSVCGNGRQEPGEACDAGVHNGESDSGCTANCLNQGTPTCVSTGAGIFAKTPCCGNNVKETGEACDDGNTNNGDGCSSHCVKEGASFAYDPPSFCGDGLIGTGEACDVLPQAAGGEVGPFGVSRISVTAPQEVNPATKLATATIAASVGGKTGTASLALSCACTTDASCGGKGCGVANCCADHPTLGADIAPSPSGSTNVCRNAALWLTFSKTMDAASLGNGNVALELLSISDKAPTADQCTSAGGSFTGSHCFIKLNFSSAEKKVFVQYQTLLASKGKYRLIVMGDVHPEDEVKTGVLSADQVTLAMAPSSGTSGLAPNQGVATQFTVGDTICTMDQVRVRDLGKMGIAPPELPSEGLFTKAGEANETHLLEAGAFARNGTQPIVSVVGTYEWTWSWGETIPATETGKNIVNVIGTNSQTARVAAVGNNGEETVIAGAEVTVSSDPQLPKVGTTLNGDIRLAALLCQRPSDHAAPYKQDDANFSFYYCRDFGDPKSIADDLPELSVALVPNQGLGFYRETLFKLEGTPDALGIRVKENPGYLPPEKWYAAQGFKGSPTSTKIDGYEAVQDGTTWYVFAPNAVAGGILYPNIYIISYNPDARPSSKEAFTRIINSWTFNAAQGNVTDNNLCRKTDQTFVRGISGTYVSCSWDGDCVDRCTDKKCTITGSVCAKDTDCSLFTGLFCDAQKAKLRRDTRRLADIVRLQKSVDDFGALARHCSIAKTQPCLSEAQCAIGESCLSNVPALSAGSFIRTLSTSAWPSWAAVLGNAVGAALPQDPLNAFLHCPATHCSVSTAMSCAKNADCPASEQCIPDAGYGADTCFNGAETKFLCPAGSHVYGFQSVGGESYTLYAQLEYADGIWHAPIETKPHTTIVVENAKAGSSKGFISGSSFCGGAVTGTSVVCGDGVIGTLPSGEREACELGQVRVDTCANGFRNIPCVNVNGACTYQASAATVCTPFRCGNGVKETGEECDDGAKNGTYGSHCKTDCHIGKGPSDGTFFCGDGYVSGGEQCDCGTNALSSLPADSWAKANCTEVNGEYVSDTSKSCTIDCKRPGPSCGDGIVQTNEECELGQTRTTIGYCSRETTKACKTNTDCGAGDACTSCSSSRVCEKGDANKIGKRCSQSADCGPDGICSAQTYPLGVMKSCIGSGLAGACHFEASWSTCQALTLPRCGDGKTEGTEACDDGSANGDNKRCTSECRLNVCGDGKVFTGIEACDRGDATHGDQNGKECSATYGSTCSYCTNKCEYQTKSGAFCGDGIVNGTEQCDGNHDNVHVLFSCIKQEAGAWKRRGSCPENGADTDCASGEQCKKTGICNGGAINGAVCISDAECGGGGACIFPTCAADCGSSCPYVYQKVPVKVQPKGANQTPKDAVTLFSSDSGHQPDGGLLLVPACTAGAQLTADIDDSSLVRPAVDIVFVTDLSGSMGLYVGSSDPAPLNEQRLTYVKQSLSSAIGDLFAGAHSVKLRIGLVSFKDSHVLIDTPPTNSNPPQCLENMCDANAQQFLVDTVNSYTVRGDTPTLLGMTKGIEILKATSPPNTQKILVLLTDGAPNGGTNEVEAVHTLITQNSGIKFFSAAIASDVQLRGQTAHMSSDTCGNLWTDPQDCKPTDRVAYAYAAQDAAGISLMYRAITNTVLGTTISYATLLNGAPVFSSGSVRAGKQVSLPFPGGFTCLSQPFTVPFATTFAGNDRDGNPGTINFSNFNFTYCPVR